MNKIISFSLWGDDKLYCQGAIENVKLAKIYYPDWKCRFYIAKDCPAIQGLKDLEEESELVIMDVDYLAIDRADPNWHKNPNHIGMLWRFYAIDDPNVETVIFRDCDSRIGAREARAVNEWLLSGYAMHRMHECKEHWNAQVMGGMWGIHTSVLRGQATNSINEYLKIYTKIRNEPWIFVDLWWIMDCLWPSLHQYCLGHGYGHPNPFVIDGPMVGGVVNEEWRGQKYV
jgi:hypothetical protein